MNLNEVYIPEEHLQYLKMLATKNIKFSSFDKQAGKQLHKSQHTLHGWRKNLFKIFGVNTTKSLLQKAKEKGLILLLLLFSLPVFSQIDSSLAGGRMQYKVLGASNYTPGDSAYFIGVYLYKKKSITDVPPYYGYPDSITVFIWNNDNDSIHAVRRQALANVVDLREDSVFCQTGLAPLNYSRALYGVTVDFHINNTGYTASTQICCRLNGYANIADGQGETLYCVIPAINNPDSNPDFVD